LDQAQWITAHLKGKDDDHFKKKKMTDESYKFHMFFCKYNLLSVKKKGLGRRHFFNRVVTMESQTSLKCAWLAT
jgi:hypothetical protein